MMKQILMLRELSQRKEEVIYTYMQNILLEIKSHS